MAGVPPALPGIIGGGGTWIILGAILLAVGAALVGYLLGGWAPSPLDARPMALGTGQQITTVFDLNYKPVTLITGEVLDYAFDYDAAGRITAITDNLDSDRTRKFGYDMAGRLISATGPFGSRSFTYDKTGNRLTRTLDEVVQTYTYTTGTNKLSQITDANGSTS